jgi:predicted transcriptional regulator
MTAQPSNAGGSDAGRACSQSGQRDILALLDDSYTREILTCLRDGPKPAHSVVANCDCSRPTVYRRLARLEETGVVSASVRYDPDGHHRKRFHLCVDKITITLDESGIVINTQTA